MRGCSLCSECFRSSLQRFGSQEANSFGGSCQTAPMQSDIKEKILFWLVGTMRGARCPMAVTSSYWRRDDCRRDGSYRPRGSSVHTDGTKIPKGGGVVPYDSTSHTICGVVRLLPCCLTRLKKNIVVFKSWYDLRCCQTAPMQSDKRK